MRQTVPMRKLLVPLVAVLAASLAGCAPEACPAIGWSSSLTVELTGDTSPVHLVELCSEGTCSGPVQRAPDTGAKNFLPVPSTGAVSRGPVSEGTELEEPSPYSASRVDDNTWHMGFMMQTPTAVTVRALTAGGKVLAEENFTLEWTRVGGSEQCGGPMKADPVVLEL